MQVTHSDDFSHLPESTRVHTVDGLAPERTLQQAIKFPDKIDTILGLPIDITLRPCGWQELTCTIIDGKIKKEFIPFNPNTVLSGTNRFNLETEKYRFEVIEHIVGVLTWLNMKGVDIHIDISKWGISWPSEITWQEEYARALFGNSETSPSNNSKYFTVNTPINFDFWGKRSTRVSFLPAKSGEEGKCFIDINVNYDEASIGWKKRMIFDTADTETFLERVAPSRTPSYGMRRRLLNTWWPLRPIVSRIPWIPRGLERNAALQIFPDCIGNPQDRYRDLDGEQGTEWMELLYHEVLDKLGALWIDFFQGGTFSGTIVFEQSSHDTDMGALTKLSGKDFQSYMISL